MLEEVQVAQLLDLGVVNRVFARDLWMGKTSTSREIDINREPPLARVEIYSLHKPRSLDAKGRLEHFVCHQGYCPPSAHPCGKVMVPPTLVHPITLTRRPHSGCGVVDGANRPRPQPHSSATTAKQATGAFLNPLEIQKRPKKAATSMHNSSAFAGAEVQRR